MKKALTWLLLAIAVMWVVKDPAGAANLGRQAAHFLGQAAAAFGTLASSL